MGELDGKKRQKAMKEELKSIEDNGVRVGAALHPRKTVILCKMMFKRKLHDKRNVGSMKTRLRGTDLLLKKDIGYSELFALVVLFELLMLPGGKF